MYNGNKSTPTASPITAKLFINSTISTPKAKFYGMDQSNFYLMTPMKEYEYMQHQLELIPDKIIRQYNLRDLVNEQGWVYVEIQMGMYGLPQAGILANKLLEQQLNTKGYYHCQHTPGYGATYGKTSASVSWLTTSASNPHLVTTSFISRPL
jgi:hypothetical protein